MEQVLLVCQSQTEALALKRMLAGAGVSGQIVRPPREAAMRSCTFAVRIARRDLMTAQRRMREKHFVPCGIL